MLFSEGATSIYRVHNHAPLPYVDMSSLPHYDWSPSRIFQTLKSVASLSEDPIDHLQATTDDVTDHDGTMAYVNKALVTDVEDSGHVSGSTSSNTSPHYVENNLNLGSSSSPPPHPRGASRAQPLDADAQGYDAHVPDRQHTSLFVDDGRQISEPVTSAYQPTQGDRLDPMTNSRRSLRGDAHTDNGGGYTDDQWSIQPAQRRGSSMPSPWRVLEGLDRSSNVHSKYDATRANMPRDSVLLGDNTDPVHPTNNSLIRGIQKNRNRIQTESVVTIETSDNKTRTETESSLSVTDGDVHVNSTQRHGDERLAPLTHTLVEEEASNTQSRTLLPTNPSLRSVSKSVHNKDIVRYVKLAAANRSDMSEAGEFPATDAGECSPGDK